MDELAHSSINGLMGNSKKSFAIKMSTFAELALTGPLSRSAIRRPSTDVSFKFLELSAFRTFS